MFYIFSWVYLPLVYLRKRSICLNTFLLSKFSLFKKFQASRFEVIVDSQEGAKKYTGRPGAPFSTSPPVLTCCMTIVRHQHQDTNGGRTHGARSGFPSYMCTHSCACMCVWLQAVCHVYSFLHHSRDA